MHGAKARVLPQTVPKNLDVRWLEEGKPIERELSGGESHSYQLNVTTGQYARVVVEQKGIDVVVSVRIIILGQGIKPADNGGHGTYSVQLSGPATFVK